MVLTVNENTPSSSLSSIISVAVTQWNHTIPTKFSLTPRSGKFHTMKDTALPTSLLSWPGQLASSFHQPPRKITGLRNRWGETSLG